MFSIDDVAFDGPLAYYFEYYIDLASQWYDIGWNVLQGLIALHLVAIAWYQLRKRQPLIQTMCFGTQPGRESEHAPVGNGRAIVVEGFNRGACDGHQFCARGAQLLLVVG